MARAEGFEARQHRQDLLIGSGDEELIRSACVHDATANAPLDEDPDARIRERTLRREAIETRRELFGSGDSRADDEQESDCGAYDPSTRNRRGRRVWRDFPIQPRHAWPRLPDGERVFRGGIKSQGA